MSKFSQQNSDINKQKSEKTFSIWQVTSILFTTVLLVSWFKQHRLNEYWQQTYQSSQIWDKLAEIPYWQTGSSVERLLQIKSSFIALENVNNQANLSLNQTFYPLMLQEKEMMAKERAEQHAKQVANQQVVDWILSQQQTTDHKPLVKPLQAINLHSGQKVFFAGDSMMQGVAPWVMQELKQKYQINSLNLSKQSTGLSYSSFFDWPATIEKTLQDNPDIAVMVVFLGANDPWAIPDPEQKNSKYVQFGSERWREIYTDKVQRILDAAKSHNVQVVWITPPTMKKPKLSQQMEELTQIFHQAIPTNQALLIDSKPILSNNNQYSDSISLDGKLVKVRTADGIHFTPTGQKLIAKAIVAKLDVQTDNNMS